MGQKSPSLTKETISKKIGFKRTQNNPIEQFFNVDETNHCACEHNNGHAKQSLSEFIDVVEKPHILFVRINFFLLI
jgi:hypothetical protein